MTTIDTTLPTPLSPSPTPTTPTLSPSSPRYNSLHTISATPLALENDDRRGSMIDLGSREDLLELQEETDGDSPVSVRSFEGGQDVVRIRGEDSVEEGMEGRSVGGRKRFTAGSMFYENMDHDVTLLELQSFLHPHGLPPSPPKRRPSLRHRLKPLLHPTPHRAPLTTSETPNFLQRIISPASVFAPVPLPLRQIHSNSTSPTKTVVVVPASPTRPSMGSRASTTPESVPTITTGRRTEQPVGRAISVRRSSLIVSPAVGSLGAAAIGSTSKTQVPMTTRAGLLAVPTVGSPKKRNSMLVERKAREQEKLGASPGSPKPKRPLSGLFRRSSSSKTNGSGKEGAGAGNQPIRTAVVVTAPTPQKERGVALRREESPSPAPRNKGLGGRVSPGIPSRRSSSFEDPAVPRVFVPSERSSSTSSSSGGGGWKNLWRKKKVGNKSPDLNDSGSEFRVVGRRRASTFSSVGESSSSASMSGGTNTDMEYLDSGVFGNTATFASIDNHILDRIEEDRAGGISRSGTVIAMRSTNTSSTVLPPPATSFLQVTGASLDRRRSSHVVTKMERMETMTIPADEDLEYLGRRKARSWGSWPDGGQWDTKMPGPMMSFAFPFEEERRGEKGGVME